MNCANHPNIPAASYCSSCGKPLCGQCRIMSADGQSAMCAECHTKLFPPQVPAKKKRGKWWVIAAVLFVLIIAVIGTGGNDEADIPINPDVPLDVADNAANDVHTTDATSEKEHPQTVEYGEGMYKVGIDLPAGEYILVCNDNKIRMGYMCVSSDSNQDDIIINEIFDTHHYVTVENGQYLELTRCIAVSAAENSLVIKDPDNIGEGMYMVGRDIPAGEYKLTAIQDAVSAYSCIYDNSTAERDIVSNDIITNNSYVTVSEGQYLLFTDCTASPVK